MPSDKDKVIEAAFREVEALAQVPHDFLRRLYHHPDDWAFVIQTHALIEGSLSQFVTAALGDQRLLPIMERLSVGDSRTGKLAFAQALGVLSHEHITFVRTVPRLRNQLVHEFRKHIPFSLTSYIGGLSDVAREQMFRAVFCVPVQPSVLDSYRKNFLTDPKLVILLGLMHFIGHTVGRVVTPDRTEPSGG